jgi:cell division FtsZ-interacting protein ZapD
MSESKTFDCVMIVLDDKQRKRVRFANDLAKRVKVLERANMKVLFAKSLDKAMTKHEALSVLESCDEVDIDDSDAIEYMRKVLNKQNTSVDDVVSAIDLNEIKSRDRIVA